MRSRERGDFDRESFVYNSLFPIRGYSLDAIFRPVVIVYLDPLFVIIYSPSQLGKQDQRFVRWKTEPTYRLTACQNTDDT